MKGRRVAFFAMGEPTHFQMLRPVISGIAKRRIDAYVFTDRRLASEVGSPSLLRAGTSRSG